MTTLRAGKLFRRFCQQRGMAVEVFTDPIEALKAAKITLPSLFVTDLKMPGMTGIELLEAIRTLDKEVPVIITTGYSTVENAVEALRLGATDFIRKPYDMEELLHQIEQTLEHSVPQDRKPGTAPRTCPNNRKPRNHR